jgi:hypothetical protein
MQTIKMFPESVHLSKRLTDLTFEHKSVNKTKTIADLKYGYGTDW